MQEREEPSPIAAALRAIADGAQMDAAAVAGVAAGDAEVADALLDLSARAASLRRRGAELRALVSSTRELLGTHDTAVLLQRIVERAHELLDADVAYLSVYEPSTDELYVRAQTGTISPRFAGMVVPAGVGLASHIVRTRRPQSVDDYREMTGLPHDSTIDQIVSEDQLRALVGAPLVVDGQVLGVLFAASRTPHSFRAEEIALLSAFAGHAALVLHVARLLASATEASAEATWRQQQAEWAAALHAELTELVVRGHPAGDIVAALAGALGREVALIAQDEAIAGPQSLVDAAVPLRDAAAEATASGRGIVLDGGAVEMVAPVPSGAGRPALLVVGRGTVPMTDVEQRTVERSALTAALVLLRRDVVDDAEERVRGELAADLLETESSRRSALRRATARGLQIDGPWCAVVVPSAVGDRARVVSALRAVGDRLVTKVPDGVVAFVPGADVAAIGRGTTLADVAPLVVVRAHRDLEQAAADARHTRRVAELARGLGASGILDAKLLAPYALLTDGDPGALLEFVEEMLAPVLAWDGPGGTTLFDTLVALQDEHWAASATARRLHVHPNTLKQRRSRLRALLGAAIDDPEARFRLELAVRVERARRLLGHAAR
ncbi:GAF domain-containing protein [Microbacterium sp. KR10-403]|uniref:helix-turn-helix domain-containing protein n=1 Tax=Microbacterium sp. KR10-403 TaxID=3158581 RepID=UPI0032E51E1C